jgi:hypothetical protein
MDFEAQLQAAIRASLDPREQVVIDERELAQICAALRESKNDVSALKPAHTSRANAYIFADVRKRDAMLREQQQQMAEYRARHSARRAM